MYVCLCFGVTEQQVHAHVEAGACSPRQIASACKAGTDCGGCVKRIQAMLGRPAGAKRRTPVRTLAAAPVEGVRHDSGRQAPSVAPAAPVAPAAAAAVGQEAGAGRAVEAA